MGERGRRLGGRLSQERELMVGREQQRLRRPGCLQAAPKRSTASWMVSMVDGDSATRRIGPSLAS